MSQWCLEKGKLVVGKKQQEEQQEEQQEDDPMSLRLENLPNPSSLFCRFLTFCSLQALFIGHMVTYTGSIRVKQPKYDTLGRL